SRTTSRRSWRSARRRRRSPPGGSAPRSATRWILTAGRRSVSTSPTTGRRAFVRRRSETLALLGSLSPAQWRRGGRHPSRGPLTIADYAEALAAHDANHLAQLQRALQGRA